MISALRCQCAGVCMEQKFHELNLTYVQDYYDSSMKMKFGS